MILSLTEKIALRKMRAEKNYNRGEMAKLVGVTDKTLRGFLDNDEPQEVKNSTYQKVAKLIASDY